ncbi:hypothetical protein ACWTU6_30160 [Mesorhizobium sp. BHbsci]
MLLDNIALPELFRIVVFVSGRAITKACGRATVEQHRRLRRAASILFQLVRPQRRDWRWGWTMQFNPISIGSSSRFDKFRNPCLLVVGWSRIVPTS